MAAAHWLIRRLLLRRGPIGGRIRRQGGGPSTWARLMQPAAVASRGVAGEVRELGLGGHVWVRCCLLESPSRGKCIAPCLRCPRRVREGHPQPTPAPIGSLSKLFAHKAAPRPFLSPGGEARFPFLFPGWKSDPAAGPTGEASPPVLLLQLQAQLH